MTNPYLMISFKNDGTVKVPDIYGREGVHGVNLINHEWNDVIFEIEGLPRDRMTEMSFSYYLNGPERLTAGTMELFINEIKLEQISEPEISKGWLPQNNTLIYSHNGYSKDMPKVAFLCEQACCDYIYNSRQRNRQSCFHWKKLPKCNRNWQFRYS